MAATSCLPAMIAIWFIWRGKSMSAYRRGRGNISGVRCIRASLRTCWDGGSFNVSLPPRERYLDSIAYLPALDRERALFSPDFLARQKHGSDPLHPYRRHFDNAPATDRLGRLLYLDTKTYL